MALYRTYRPGRLDEVVGQDHVIEPLRRALTNDRVHHAYLFSGPRGCGKTSTARILARSLNCAQGPTADPCGECQSCIDLAPNGAGSIDVIELDAASHGKVDDTRELRERAMFAPVASRYKVYIIDEAHMVTTQGFNALLKLVEEPPPHVRFIFATTDPDKVLQTIRSRTHNYAFRLVPVRLLQQHLQGVCEAEGVPADPAALAVIARAGAGSVRDSLSLLGQVIAGSGPDGVTYQGAVDVLGVTDARLLDGVIDAVASHDGAALFTAVEEVIDVGHDPRRFVTDLLERWRDLIILTSVSDAVERGMIEGPADEVDRMREQASRMAMGELSRAADVTSDALGELKGATAPRLHLELMAARLLLPASDDDEAGLRARLDQVERRLAAGAVTAAPAPAAAPAQPRSVPRRLSEVAPSTVAPAAEPAPAPAPPAADAAPEPVAPTEAVVEPAVDEPPVEPPAPPSTGRTLDLDEIRSLWPAILEALKAGSRVAAMVFIDSHPVSLSNGVLAVAVDGQGRIINIQQGKHDERLRQAILDVARVDVRIDVVLDGERARAGTAVRANAAAASAAPVDAEPDEPSADDPDEEDVTGVDLAIRELDATRIGEIET